MKGEQNEFVLGSVNGFHRAFSVHMRQFEKSTAHISALGRPFEDYVEG